IKRRAVGQTIGLAALHMPWLACQRVDAELAQRRIVDDVDTLKVNFVTLAGEPDQQQVSAEVIKVAGDEFARLAFRRGLFLGLALGLFLGTLLLGLRLLLCSLFSGCFLACFLGKLLLAFGLGGRLALALCRFLLSLGLPLALGAQRHRLLLG